MIKATVDTANLSKACEDMAARFIAAQNTSLVRAADRVLLESGKQVPLDSGWLQSTGEVLDEAAGVSLVYRGPYAAYQHEGVRADGTHLVQNWQHGRKKKFLEDPINSLKPELLQTIASSVKAQVL